METRLKKHFTLLSVITPIFIMYKVGPIPVVTLLMAFWVIEYVMFCIINASGGICVINKPLLTFFLYSFVMSLLHILGQNTALVDFNALLNYHFCLLMIVLWGTAWFDGVYGYKWLKRISVFSTIYVYLQSLLYGTTRYVLSGFIPFLETEYMESAEKVMQGVAYRPTSIFAEPAGYGIYIAVFVLLYINMEKRRNNLFLIFLCFGVALSQSSAGLISITYVLITDFMVHIVRRKIKKMYLMFPVALIIGFAALYKMGYVELVVNHLFDRQNGQIVMAAGLTQRIGEYAVAWESLEGVEQILFGVGFLKNQFFYLPGFIKLLYFYGIIGVVAFLFVHILFYKRMSGLGKKIMALAFVLSFFSNTILGVQPIVFYPLIINMKNGDGV